MRVWVTIVVFILFSAPLVVGQRWVDDVSESGDVLTLSEAVEYTTDGVKQLNLFDDPQSAKALFERAILSDSTYAPARYSLAQLLMYSTPDSALIHAKVAYLQDTLNPRYLAAYAQSEISNEGYEQAQDLFEKLIELQPRDINAYRVLALLYSQYQRGEDAVSLLDSAAVRVGYNPYLANLKRQILISSGQYERALEEANAIAEEMPYSIDGHLALAELYRSAKQDSMARESYKRAMEIDSMSLETLIAVADFNLNTERNYSNYFKTLRLILKSKDMALDGKLTLIKELMSDRDLYRRESIAIGALITTLVIEHPHDESVVEIQAQHLVSMGMIDEALAVFKNRLSDEPPVINYYRSVIDIERYKERIDSVEYYINAAILEFPEEDSFKYELAYQLSANKRYDEAIELYKERLEGASDTVRSSLWGTIGDLYHQIAIESQGDKRAFKRSIKSCYAAYDMALELYPENEMVLNNYAYFLCEYGGDLKRALEMSKLSVEIDGSNPTFIDTYAWLLYRLGRYEEAKVEMRRAVSLDTTQNGEIALHYGAILAALGESTMAAYYWDKALEWGVPSEVVEASKAVAAELNKGVKK